MTGDTYDLTTLVRTSFGEKETEKHGSYVATEADIKTIGRMGLELLRRTKYMPGICAYISSALVAAVKEKTEIQVYGVAGDLYTRGRPTFVGRAGDTTFQFESSDLEWEGHCWVAFGQYIVDASIFRTAYAQSEDSNLKMSVLQEFGPNRGLLIDTVSGLNTLGFSYRPRHVLTGRQVSALVLSALALGIIN